MTIIFESFKQQIGWRRQETLLDRMSSLFNDGGYDIEEVGKMTRQVLIERYPCSYGAFIASIEIVMIWKKAFQLMQ